MDISRGTLAAVLPSQEWLFEDFVRLIGKLISFICPSTWIKSLFSISISRNVPSKPEGENKLSDGLRKTPPSSDTGKGAQWTEKYKMDGTHD